VKGGWLTVNGQRSTVNFPYSNVIVNRFTITKF